MSKIFTPVNQVRLTNIVVVRLKRAGKRFEVACYPNKVVSWRNNIEKDLSEVLQIRNVFTNVSKGELAKKEELIQAFGTDNEDEICLKILDKGELQVSDKERLVMLDQMFHEIATIIAAKCINPETQRPYTVSMIERTMKELHVAAKTSKNTKQQALEIIKLLKKHIPIERARMRLKITLDRHVVNKFKQRFDVLDKGGCVEKEEHKQDKIEIQFLVDPGAFREMDEFISEQQGVMEVIDPCVFEEGEQRLAESVAPILRQTGTDGLATSTEDVRDEDRHREEEEKKEEGEGSRQQTDAVNNAMAALRVSGSKKAKQLAKRALRKQQQQESNQADTADDELDESKAATSPIQDEKMSAPTTSKKDKRKQKKQQLTAAATSSAYGVLEELME